MGVEIERKFLLKNSNWNRSQATIMAQGYLNRDKGRNVRIRVAGKEAFITIKGENRGAVRAEFEYPIPVADAKAMLALCDGPLVVKTRYTVEYKGFTWEVDVFDGDNLGLVVAEIELDSEDQMFEKPDWVGQEVTEDPRYYNANLSSTPYKMWGNSQKTTNPTLTKPK